MRKPKRAKATKAKRTGPSRRAAAQRAAIDKRAAADTRSKRKAARKAARTAKKAAAKKPALKPIAGVLAPLVATTAGNKGRRSRLKVTRDAKGKAIVAHASHGVPAIAIGKIRIGKRHRKDFSHVPGIVASINARGGLIQPISLRPDLTLIAGESRIKAWEQSNFAGQPIPYHILDVDSIIAGEWDENATRKDFTPAEAVSIKRDVEKEFARLQAARAKSEKAAPGRKATGKLSGRGADRVAKFTGVKRESLRKAEAVVDAAAADPERFGDLVDEMNKSGKVNAAHKKLQVRAAKAAIDAAPPAMPMNARQCATWVVDFPWAGEMERDQDKLDAAGRAFRPYPEMNVKSCCAFAAEQIAPNLSDDVSLWLLVTNFILVRGYHLHVYGALGFKPDNASTMLTWGKDKIGRGQILRDQTEHAILLTRGKVTIDATGANPPSTLMLADRRENSRKPDQFWRLVERVTPAKRYASIFSQGGEGENWDSHGDQVGKFAPGTEKSKRGMVFTIKRCGDQGQHQAPHGHYLSLLHDRDQRQHTACECGFAFSVIDAHENPKLEAEILEHWAAAAAPPAAKVVERDEQRELDRPVEVKGAKRSDAPAPHQVDIEEAIAATPAPAGEMPDIQPELRRKNGAAAAA